MGCIVSKQGSVIEAQPVRTEIQQHLYKDIDRNGKTSVMFDIDLDTCESVGDHKGDHLKPSKSEARIPARLAPIQNPPVLTAEMIEEKLRRAEEKREQLLASRRLACQKAKQTPNLMMQGKKISTENPLDTQPPAHSTSWILNWSGDETLTDEQLDAILQSEAEFRKPMEENL
ncbi:hypothetical protein D915_001707 [Fasciola hepatica]|uniref:Uncharacterized protein n=1 Tax=Fasciola hepatica TaxID=6192 RepID=A0A4E0RF30_FASHE|nr:hypothetical protein D915_001707 [Fasciola hepatica]